MIISILAKFMKKSLLLLSLGIISALQMASAGDITGTITLKGTAPAEREITPLKGVPSASTGASADPVVLDQKGCLYSPTIMAVQTGQKIIVKNSDPCVHNIHPVPKENPESNQVQMPGAADLTFTFDKPEPFLKFQCDVHPWMFAWVSVFDHPYFAVTGVDGKFVIKNVPPGKYTIVAAHRKAGTQTADVEVKDGNATVNFTFEAK